MEQNKSLESSNKLDEIKELDPAIEEICSDRIPPSTTDDMPLKESEEVMDFENDLKFVFTDDKASISE